MSVYGFTVNVDGNAQAGMAKINASLAGMGATATMETAKVKGAFSGLTSMFGGLKSMLIGGLGIGAAFKGFEFLSSGIEKAHALEQATAKIQANLSSTGGSAGMGMSELKDFASGLSSKIQASKIDIMDMQSQLLTFPAITKDVFQQSMGLVADIAKQTNHGLSETAIMYGKALNDPTKGLQKMMRYGVMFTDAEKEKIKALQASGKLIESQKFMMEAIAHSGYAGVAARMFDADPAAKFNKQLGKIQVGFGEMFMEVKSNVLPVISSFLSSLGDLYGWLTNNNQVIADVAVAITSLGLVIAGVTLYANAAAIAYWGLGVAFSALSVVTGIATFATWLFSAALWSTGIPEIVIAIAALTAGIIALYHHFGSLGQAFKAAWDIMKAGLSFIINQWKALGEVIIGVLTFDVGMIKQGWSDWVDSFSNAAQEVVDIWNNTSDKISTIGSHAQGGVGFMGGIQILPILQGITGHQEGATPGQNTPKGNALKQNALNTSELAGAKGGLGESKIINIKIDTMQRIEKVNGVNDLKGASEVALSILVRALNNLAYSQSSTM